ncbi:hypothetical protein HY229_07975 [Candidatus Acetothermia bacterium]|nr:hypothetical protein [Candidatus Acetothermia bacterium]MBI3644017.1 hypothetical protein [Candidatus Acetothermia bacterium]
MILQRQSRLIGILVLLLIGAFASSGQAQSAITLLDMGAGVRALAMGEAFVGLADDEQAAFYNPAGLAYLSGIYASANYESHLGASSYLSLLGATHGIGLGLFLFSLGDVEQRDDQDKVLGTFGYSNFAVTASGGLPLSQIPLGFTRSLDSLSMGGRFKFLGVSTLEGGNGSAIALDLSWFFKGNNAIDHLLPGSGIHLFQAGLSIENLVSIGLGYAGGHHERLPFKIKTGFAISPMQSLTLSMDLAIPFEFHLGGEYSLSLPSPLSHMDIRAGAVVRGGTFAFTAGFGVVREPFRLDYAFVSHPSLPGSHRLALSLQF